MPYPTSPSLRRWARRQPGTTLQLLLPLGTALAVTGAPPAALGLAAGALLVHGALTREGVRWGLRPWAVRAVRLALGGALLAWGARALGAEARGLLALPLLLGLEVRLFAWGRQARGGVGRAIAGAARAAWAVPVALAGGLSLPAALGLFGAFALSAGLATAAVHAVRAAHRGSAGRRALQWGAGLATAGGLLALSAWAVAHGARPEQALAGLLPSGAGAAGACLLLPPVRRARGWLLGAQWLTALALVLSLR